jgi:hypothetical protein
MKPETYERMKQLIPADKHSKYNAPGIYCIYATRNGQKYLLYIGKSKNMLRRLCEHLLEMEKTTWRSYRGEIEQKYYLLNDFIDEYYQINFDVMCYCDEEFLTEEEDELIAGYNPPLNTVKFDTETKKHYRVKLPYKYVEEVVKDAPTSFKVSKCQGISW